MSQLEMGKPSLPSIQFLLQEAPDPNIIPNTSMDDSHMMMGVTNTTSHKRQYGHRQSRSVSSLPLDLQSLSLQAPEDRNIMVSHPPPPPPPPAAAAAAAAPPMQHITRPLPHHEPYNGTPFSATEKAPSWMIPNDRPSMIFNNNDISRPTRRKPSFAGHGRSISEFTLPPLSSSSSSSLNTSPPLPPSSASSTASQVKQSHRRAVSANTIDFMLAPAPTSMHDYRAQSYSPQEPPSLVQQQLTTNTMQFFDQIENNNTNTTTTADTSGRYVCPYCHKKFSRPSSLRIHTYSHTGEKPFECDFPGCGRHFSVQSNMRRHLRVHRLGRGSGGAGVGNLGGSNISLETTNEEA